MGGELFTGKSEMTIESWRCAPRWMYEALFHCSFVCQHSV